MEQNIYNLLWACSGIQKEKADLFLEYCNKFDYIIDDVIKFAKSKKNYIVIDENGYYNIDNLFECLLFKRQEDLLELADKTVDYLNDNSNIFYKEKEKKIVLQLIENFKKYVKNIDFENYNLHLYLEIYKPFFCRIDDFNDCDLFIELLTKRDLLEDYLYEILQEDKFAEGLYEIKTEIQEREYPYCNKIDRYNVEYIEVASMDDIKQQWDKYKNDIIKKIKEDDEFSNFLFNIENITEEIFFYNIKRWIENNMMNVDCDN